MSVSLYDHVHISRQTGSQSRQQPTSAAKTTVVLVSSKQCQLIDDALT